MRISLNLIGHFDVLEHAGPVGRSGETNRLGKALLVPGAFM